MFNITTVVFDWPSPLLLYKHVGMEHLNSEEGSKWHWAWIPLKNTEVVHAQSAVSAVMFSPIEHVKQPTSMAKTWNWKASVACHLLDGMHLDKEWC